MSPETLQTLTRMIGNVSRAQVDGSRIEFNPHDVHIVLDALRLLKQCAEPPAQWMNEPRPIHPIERPAKPTHTPIPGSYLTASARLAGYAQSVSSVKWDTQEMAAWSNGLLARVEAYDKEAAKL